MTTTLHVSHLSLAAVGFCISPTSFTRAAATLRFFQNILAVAALAFLWLGLPPEVDYTPALSTSARFMTQQVSYAKEIPDAALLSANSAVDFKGAPGYFPTGADPVKYAPAIAYTTTMLSWSLTQFGQGFEYTSSVKDAVEMVTAGADYLVASTQVKGAEATSFIARVGDPALYIDRGVGEVDPPIDRIWATPEAELKREMEKKPKGAQQWWWMPKTLVWMLLAALLLPLQPLLLSPGPTGSTRRKSTLTQLRHCML